MTASTMARLGRRLRCASAAVFALLAGAGMAATELADQPIFAAPNVPGNLLLALSVEWPTASTPAYLSTEPYRVDKSYLGYFDAGKCYEYVYDSATPAKSYFKPVKLADDRNGDKFFHRCTSTTAAALWSGNYMNWSSTHTLDAFRWALTGGARAEETEATTILEKTFHTVGKDDTGSPDPNVNPDKVLAVGISDVTPFSDTRLTSKVHGLGNAMQFMTGESLKCTFKTTGDGFGLTTRFDCDVGAVSLGCQPSPWLPMNSGESATCSAGGTSTPRINCTVSRSVDARRFSYSCTASTSPQVCSVPLVMILSNSSSVTTYCPAAAETKDYSGQSVANGQHVPGTIYTVYVRVKVCDKDFPEPNCKRYGGNAKPEGLIQKYAMSLRYSAFGYLNDDDKRRDGGVMRARMKFVGPQMPVPGSTAVSNPNTEWSTSTGMLIRNADPADATATAARVSNRVSVNDSGVINYLNNFGRVVPGTYKHFDPVSELFYASLRYYRNLGDVADYSKLVNSDAATLAKWIDGFPVIRNWDDPITFACQRNYILGIGDVKTHNDANLRGSSIRSLEPVMPSEVSSDTGIDVIAANRMVGKLEGLGYDLATYTPGQNSSYFMAGLAYDAHTRDIRSDLPGSQTVSTFWMDVMEAQEYIDRNQYWLAAKYGGFDVPTGFDPYAAGNGPGTLPLDSWHNTPDLLGATKRPRPDNYFLATAPERLVEGLTSTFERINRNIQAVTSTAFANPTASLSTSGTANYSASYDPRNWSGLLLASTLVPASDDRVVTTKAWDARELLEKAVPNDRKIITCCTTTGAGLPFRAEALSKASELLPRTAYASFAAVPGVSGTQSAADFVDYLRGDRSKEVSNDGPYRSRAFLLGDIVGSKVSAVAGPSSPYFDAANKGYDKFRRKRAGRKTVVYVGANDGMVHAFDGRVPRGESCPECGTELFAYVPSFAFGGSASSPATTGLASLGNPSFVHHYLVDATPRPFDVDIARTSAAASAAPDWRTLLIGGLGKGGKGYYALDVSDPSSWDSETAVAKKLLWEFEDKRLGYSFGDASVVKTAKYGWVVIVTSGYANSDGKGWFFFIRPSTGELLEAVATPEGSVTAPLDMAMQTAFVPDYGDFTADAVYAGDLRGNVWRLDLTRETGSYDAPVKVAQARDGAGQPQPITTRPLIESSLEGVAGKAPRRYLMFGTGRLLAASDVGSSQTQSFYVVADGTPQPGGFAVAPPTGNFPITRGDLAHNADLLRGVESSAGWYIDLGRAAGGNVAERINVAPTANSGVVAVGVNVPNGDTCSPGGSHRLFAVDFRQGSTLLADAAGTAIASTALASGAVVDVAMKSSGGKVRIGLGDSSGGGKLLTPRSAAPRVLRILNWREVPTAN